MTSPAASSLALPILDAELEQRLRARMEEVEQELEEAIQSEADFVTQAARHLMPGRLCFMAATLLRLAARTLRGK